MTTAPSAPDANADAPDWAQDMEAKVLAEAIRLASDHPWNAALVVTAAKAAGLGQADAELLLPNGARDLVALLARRHDALTLARLAKVDLATLKIRERITLAVEERVEAAMADETAVKRASLFLAHPGNAALGVSLAWTSADALWRWAGDTSTDENHYSKRAILAGVLTPTLAVRLSAGRTRAKTYLDRRIENVMGFEKWKGALPQPIEALAGAAAFLGRLRYGAGLRSRASAGRASAG
jgi:ubiquinone biosynthesis protein COQ9